MKLKKILLIMLLATSSASFASGDEELISGAEEVATEVQPITTFLQESLHSFKMGSALVAIALLTDYVLVELDVNPWKESMLEQGYNFVKDGICKVLGKSDVKEV